jgi:predicted O-methyltransferase YrrM
MSGAEDVAMTKEQANKIVWHIGVVYNVLLYRDPTREEIQRHGDEIMRGQPLIDFFMGVLLSEERRDQPKAYVGPGHFYSPIVNPAELHHHLRAVANAGPEISGIALERDRMIATWETLLPFLTTCPFSNSPAGGFRYGFVNPAYGYGDGVVLQAMLRYRRPKRLIEVGSGYSTMCSVDTIDHFLGGACEVTSIEPQPERVRSLLGDRERGVHIINAPVQRVPVSVFEQLEAGDILFIDSTHVLRTGSDVCYELFEIFPRLASGVAVHLHDIFWPFEYPEPWLLDDNRSWNEAYAVRAFLTDNDRWEILFFNDYFVKFERERIERELPRFAEGSGGALWLQRR